MAVLITEVFNDNCETLTEANAAEDGSSMYGIELIDPVTVKRPVNVLL
jgi:hypothetical protein